MGGEQGFIATHEMVHLVKFTGKGCSIFFCAYVTLLSTTGYKVLKYSSRNHMVYLAAQQQNKLIQFPVCAYVGVLFTLGLREPHPNSIFSLAILVLEYHIANNVTSCLSAYRCFLPKTQS